MPRAIFPDDHRDVTDLVARWHVWERLTQMDSVTRAVQGKLCYPRTCWRITPSYLPSHKSWEDEEVKAKVGPKMASYFVQGAIEFIAPGGPGMEMPTVIEPRGEVPKKGKDKYRANADAREGNNSISDWGTRVFPARELACALSWRAIVNSFNVNDGYHFAPSRAQA